MSDKKIPVIELFGPVYQGEGPLVGSKTWFLRTGGCDYLCTHCDSLHAVIPERVKENRTMMTQMEVANVLLEGCVLSSCDWVTLSGGNPVMWDLKEMIEFLSANGICIAVETQGSVWRDWIALCDSIVISPKGPGMGYGAKSLEDVENFLEKLAAYDIHKDLIALKVPILSQLDIDFASKVAKKWPHIQLFLSVGNVLAPATHFDIEAHRRSILNWTKEVTDLTLARQELSRARLFPQQHVLVYGDEKEH